ncbi:DUF7147 family protein [Sporosarcina sp. ITBMC105]
MYQQRFIELGEGFGDVYELFELMKTNKDRLHRAFIFSSTIQDKQMISLATAFTPASDSKFMPIYICREGIQQTEMKKSKRTILFEELGEQLGHPPIFIDMKHSSEFADTQLFFQYITGILRLNHLLPPLG